MVNKNHILQERAEKLAKVKAQETLKKHIEVLVFNLATEQYAIETIYIKEVCPYKNYTVLPGVPPFICGLINIRRKILTLLNLKVFLSLSMESSTNQKIIILEDGEIEFAILTDGIIGIRQILFDQIQPLLPTLMEIKLDFLQGIIMENIVLLDGKKLLSSKLFIIDEKVEN